MQREETFLIEFERVDNIDIHFDFLEWICPCSSRGQLEMFVSDDAFLYVFDRVRRLESRTFYSTEIYVARNWASALDLTTVLK